MEFNKIAAAILLAGLIGMTTGKIAGFLYDGSSDAAAHHGDEEHAEARGYSIEVTEAAEGGAAGAAEDKGLPSILPLLASADAAAGEAYFAKKCALCHGAEKGGANKTGPNLWGIINKDKGSAAGFGYSKAMAAAEGNWDFEALNGFIYKPKSYISGTIMAFAGEKKDTERANLIAYLRLQSDSPVAIPAATAPAVIEPTPAPPTPAAAPADAPAINAPAIIEPSPAPAATPADAQ